MKKHWLSLLALLSLLFTVSCQPSVTPTVPPAPTPTLAAQSNAEVVLTLTGLTGETKNFTLSDLKKLPSATGQAGIKSSTGKITPPALFKGVLMSELLNQLGGADNTTGIQVEAKDGYAMTLSTDQVMTGNFIAYDPATGDETKPTDKLQALIAYEMDGKPLDIERDGYLRLVVISSKNNQVTDGHWSIKWVRNITVKQLAREWNLALEGGIKDSIDRGSFESCSTAKCHPGTWKDEKAQTWSGTPLWVIAGRMDDAIKHGDNSFNKELAEKGYSVEVIGKDGYSVSFDIARLKNNPNILLANQVNGNPLPDADFPLRLVGSDVQKKEGVGSVQKVIIHFDQKPTPAPTATPTAAPASSAPVKLPDGKVFMVNGLVEKQQAWTLDELKKLEVVKLTVEHPKSGPQAVEGVRISTLLDLVKVKAEAKAVTFTASDGFSATTDLPALQACKDCVVAFNESGGLKLAMPGMGSGLWVKNVIAISVQ